MAWRESFIAEGIQALMSGVENVVFSSDCSCLLARWQAVHSGNFSLICMESGEINKLFLPPQG